MDMLTYSLRHAGPMVTIQLQSIIAFFGQYQILLLAKEAHVWMTYPGLLHDSGREMNLWLLDSDFDAWTITDHTRRTSLIHTLHNVE